MNEMPFLSSKSIESVTDVCAFAACSFDAALWRAERIGSPSSWWQHVPFGHWIVCTARPRVLVELGTHAGVSYSAFCQAVSRSGLDTRCYAVDTWRGDPHAEYYSEEVFEEFSCFHEERYAAFSTLLRTTFDEAINHFADGTVDLLHIDGCHTYEAVRHDFESWRPKLSKRAIVLFHDTNEHKSDFGVWRFWAELCECFPHFEFLHGHGLGVLAFGADVEPTILTLCGLLESSAVAAVRGRFAALGERSLSQTKEKMLARDLAQAQQTLREAERRVAASEARVLEGERATKLRAERSEARAAKAQIECEQARQERDALLSSTAWRATWPFRKAGQRLPPGARRAIRAGAKLGWRSLTLKLPRKFA
jgi:hypothetical protein